MDLEMDQKNKRFDSLELQQLAMQGAGFYLKERCRGMPMDKRTEIFNAVAHGIYMGFRKKESMIGIEGESWEPAIKSALGVITNGK